MGRRNLVLPELGFVISLHVLQTWLREVLGRGTISPTGVDISKEFRFLFIEVVDIHCI